MKKDNYILLIIVVIILLSILGIMYFSKEEKETSVKDIQYNLLDDYSRFFTVNSCVYKYITYLSNGDIENILNLLDEDYKISNNVNKNNLYNYINKLDGNYNFKAKKIYYGELNKNNIEYVVYGYLIKDSLDSIVSKEDYYIKVKLDLKEELFSITPYDGKIFKEVK